MRIALLTTDNREPFKDYGAPVPYFGTAPEALLQGFARLPEAEIHVVSCVRKPVRSPATLAPNIFFHSVHVPKFGWMRTFYQGCVRATRARLRRISPDLVHGQGTELDCAVSAVLSGFPNVVTIHGNMGELARLAKARIGSFGWLAARLETFALKRTAGVFCNSEYTERLVQPRSRRTWRVPNAIREQFFLPPAVESRRTKCLLLNIGVVSARKRQCEILAKAAELHRQGLVFELQFIGQASPGSPYAARFLKEVREAEKAGFARYVGPKSSAELLRSFDEASGLIHFPYEEAFGLVVAEALARGLKLFAAGVGGIRDIASGVPGAELLGPDDWEGLASSVGHWLSKGFPREPAAAAFMRQRYHPELIARHHLEIYREILEQDAAATARA